jgi:hydroxymethylglutaryl-CoA reductase (NADPH)
LCAGHLVKAHMAHNRSAVTSRAPTPAPATPAGNGTQTPVTNGGPIPRR